MKPFKPLVFNILNNNSYPIHPLPKGSGFLGSLWVKTDVYEIFEQLTRGNLEPFELVESRIITKNKEEKMIMWNNTLLYNDKGNVIGTLSAGTDITERRKAEIKLKKIETKFQNFVENAQIGIWAVDKDGYTTYTNKRMTEILGYSKEEFLNGHIFDFMDQENKKKAECYTESRKKGVKEDHTFEFLHKNGSNIQTLLSARPIYDNDDNYIGALAHISLITEELLKFVKK
ncbi:MAG: PAS domain S-box protein [Candidatus Lokiarchaeota archaeon]|nr:PAS domain S-box protein [Candidatus Lokiarchaeota archaeon]